MGPHHQYPDGLALYLGTMFVPSKDRGEKGKGFTHKVGDIVTISTRKTRRAGQPGAAFARLSALDLWRKPSDEGSGQGRSHLAAPTIFSGNAAIYATLRGVPVTADAIRSKIAARPGGRSDVRFADPVRAHRRQTLWRHGRARRLNLTVERGSIHALVGESGAGKSTLTKVLAGIVRPDRGAIEFDGKTATIDGPNAARRLGIGVVLQQPGLFAERPVLANLFVNREPVHNGLVSRRELEARSRDLLRQLGLDVDVRAPLGDLGPDERQLVAIARALLENPRLLILDDPNSALDPRQSERLFAVLRGLKAKGMSMLYASNRLEDALAIADQLTVMRNGRDVLSKARQDLTTSEEAMIGQLRQSLFPPRSGPCRRLPARYGRRSPLRGSAAAFSPGSASRPAPARFRACRLRSAGPACPVVRVAQTAPGQGAFSRWRRLAEDADGSGPAQHLH